MCHRNGRDVEKRALALKMHEEGLEVSLVAKLSELSKYEIQELKNKRD